MPRACTVCHSPDRAAIDRALVAGTSAREIAAKHRVSEDAIQRHRAHLPAALARSEAARAEAQALDVMAEIRRIMGRVNRLYDACDAWLRDPEDPDRYDLGPRADEVKVVYTEAGADGKPVQRKASMAHLLGRLESEGGLRPVSWEVRHADPRELLLKTADRLQGQLEMIARMLAEAEAAPVDVLGLPEWRSLRGALLAALRPFPEAAAAVAGALLGVEMKVEGSDAGA